MKDPQCACEWMSHKLVVVCVTHLEAVREFDGSRAPAMSTLLEQAAKWIDESFDFEMPLAKHKSGCALRDEIRRALAVK